MDKVIISLAPVAADSTQVNPLDVAHEAIEAAREGASIVHLHVREKNGQLTDNLTCFEQTIQPIIAKTGMIIQASTGGISDMNIQQRCAPLSCQGVEMASLNVGSVNLAGTIYKNSPEDVAWCSNEIVKKNIMPEFEVFELGMINNILELSESINFKNPMLFNIVLGHTGSTPSNIDTLIAMRQFIPKDALWAITDFGRQDFSVIAAAIAMGACEVRIGFEDSRYLTKTTQAKQNSELVKKLKNIITSMDKDVASIAEAREVLNLTS
ncbi:MAG: 3-keto-5-aminohexanoate cleavage protein [Alphaproteobacteria bacterium]